MKHSLIVPLGGGSRANNDELRILLRSIERNVENLDKVVLVTTTPPDWVRNVVVVPCPDAHEHNKDANLIDKTVAAVNTLGLETFAWAADDNVFNRRCDLDTLVPVYNPRDKRQFQLALRRNRWIRRMVHTFELAESMGTPLDRNYESHTPQLFRHARELLARLGKVDYVTDPGYGIHTLFYLLCPAGAPVGMTSVKTTYERPDQMGQVPDKMFIGYNDECFLGGLREKLMQLFPKKSRYEA